MRKILSILLVFVMVLTVLFASSALAASKLVPFYTLPSGGTAYILSAGIASVTKGRLKDYELVVEPTQGSMMLGKLLRERANAKREAFAIFAADAPTNLFKGEGEFAGKPFPDLRAVTFLFGADIYLVVPANSSIKSYADVKGKRVGMGGAGSTVSLTSLYFLERHGVKRQDFKPHFFGYKEVVEGLQDGSLDAGFLAGGYPVANYSELSLTHSVRIIPVDEGVTNKIVEERPYYYRTIVKANSYKGLQQDTPVIGFGGGVYTHAGVSADFIYLLMKTLFEQKENYYRIHQSAKELTPETIQKGIAVPLHPGAERYLKEIGMMKKP
jgi:uncharacterized protein